MDRLVAEIIDMRRRAPPDSLGRQLAGRCLELCLQEVAANDEDFPPPPDAVVADLVKAVVGSLC